MSKINETNYPRRTQANYADTDMLVIQAAGGNTYTTRLEDMREDYEETLAPTLSALQDDVNENLATIEESTASKAYAKGDFLVFNGRLCKAKTSIASGATLVLDTNIELDSVGDELSSLSSDLTNKLSWTLLTSVNANGTYTNLPDMSDMTELMFRLYLTQPRTTILVMNKVDFINNKAFPDIIAGSNVRIYALFEWVSTTSIKVSSLTGLTVFHQDAVIQVLGR